MPFWLGIYYVQSNFFTFRTFSVFRPELGPLFWKVIRIRNSSEPTISKKFRHRSVPVLCIFKYFRIRSVFRYLFWIFTRTRTFSVPVLWGRDTEKVRIRLRRSGYAIYLFSSLIHINCAYYCYRENQCVGLILSSILMRLLLVFWNVFIFWFCWWTSFIRDLNMFFT